MILPNKETAQELCIIYDKRYIRRTPTCLPVWHGTTRSFPGMGDSHADEHQMEQDFSTPGHQRCF